MSKRDILDYVETLEIGDLCDVYETLLEDDCYHYDLELDDALYEIEQILFSTGDEVIRMAIMEHYPDGYPTERPILTPPSSPSSNE
ncbi:hypothetical protein R1sor_001989 [Riccia sorocarpa]|uniref:Uncharacterized protein n=1 Tax=Riccia sorocarpa TaxID=122646 RepID=A0ABD3H018_9MARC